MLPTTFVLDSTDTPSQKPCVYISTANLIHDGAVMDCNFSGMFNQIWMWGILRPGQLLMNFVMFLEQLLNSF